MGHTSATADVDLARSTTGDRDVAWRHREVLVAAAAALVAAAGHDPDRATCSDAACRLADADLCDVTHRLSRLPGAPTAVAVLTFEVALERFGAALTASADAIRHCRQTVHASRECWFSPAPGGDGCGPVLHLLHRLG